MDQTEYFCFFVIKKNLNRRNTSVSTTSSERKLDLTGTNNEPAK